MVKEKYQRPQIHTEHIQPTGFLEGSTKELPYDPGDGTDDALSKESELGDSFWGTAKSPWDD